LICLQLLHEEHLTYRLKHTLSRYLDSFEQALDFKIIPTPQDVATKGTLDQKASVRMVIADRSRAKLFTYNFIEKELFLNKNVELPEEAGSAEIIPIQDQILILSLSKEITRMSALAFLSHDQQVLYQRSPDLKNFYPFTTSTWDKQQLVYVGSTNGSVYVFEVTTGNFVKEIPFQY